MKLIAFIVSAALFVCLFPSMGAAAEPASSQSSCTAPVANESARMELVSFLEDARNYTLDNGKDEAIKAFSDPNGEFVKGDMYVFAYDFNGTLLAHPYLHNLIGRNNLDLVDPNGVHFIKSLMAVAERGQGFACNVYPNPNNANRTGLKLLYALKVDDNLWIGSGIYLSSDQNLSVTKPVSRDELKTFVEEAYSHALVTSRDRALEDFMDLNGIWVRGDVYIFAQDFNGTALCLPYLPNEVGTNRMNIQNDEGVYINRDMRAIALNGSGYYEYRWRNPISNQIESKVSFVSRVDDTWWLGAGIYEAQE